jgi:hypothetical protein
MIICDWKSLSLEDDDEGEEAIAYNESKARGTG